MAEKSRKTLITGVLAAASVLVLGGLVAWGAGYFESEATSAPDTTPAVHAGEGARMLPPNHPPIDGMAAMPGKDAGCGGCPVTGAGAKTAAVMNAAGGADGCSSGKKAACGPAANRGACGDGGCPDSAKMDACGDSGCGDKAGCGPDVCPDAGSCGTGGCEEKKAPASN